MSLTKVAILTGLAGLALAASPGMAQTMSTKAAAFETGYGLARNQMQNAVDPSTRDANGNRVMVDGSMSIGSDNSVFSYSKSLGAGDSFSGAGALGGATAIGNNLSVVVNGNYNTVIIHSTQTNNGNVTATSNGRTAQGATGTSSTDSSLNGQVNLNGF